MSIAAQSGYTVFREILRIEDGLSSNNVICAVQDNKGFMWFGTSYGLNKYDGKKFKTFTQVKDGLNSNFIEKLAVDDANRLWIVSGGVLQIMNLVTHEIRNAADVVQLPFEQNQIVEILLQLEVKQVSMVKNKVLFQLENFQEQVVKVYTQ
jgi:ligand-binding sensor domain-containing protein